MTAEKTPVFLLTGFLGSGKTTLLNKALKDPTLANTAVVVNELGEIGLDNVMIAQATDNVVLLDAGCLCCANTGALHETLADLDGRRARGEIPRFERVIIETSGAADPAPLLNVLLGHPLVTAAYAFEATVCAIDAQHFLASRAEYSLAGAAYVCSASAAGEVVRCLPHAFRTERGHAVHQSNEDAGVHGRRQTGGGDQWRRNPRARHRRTTRIFGSGFRARHSSCAERHRECAQPGHALPTRNKPRRAILHASDLRP